MDLKYYGERQYFSIIMEKVVSDEQFKNDKSNYAIDHKIQEYYLQQFKQLNLKYDKSNHEDIQQLGFLLNECLCYPSSALAKVHRKANRLGQMDHGQRTKQDLKNITVSVIRAQTPVCKCCGFFIQSQNLSVSGDKFEEINNIGSSTIVFFKTIINLIILLVLMIVAYSVFALFSNILSARNSELDSSYDYFSISLGAKAQLIQQNSRDGQIYYMISSWLGVVMLLVWIISLGCMKRNISKTQNRHKRCTSVADFSIVLQKMPTDLSKETVQEAFDAYFQKLDKDDADFQRFKIQKFNEAKPFYFNQQQFKDQLLDKILKETEEIKSKFRDLILQRQVDKTFSFSKEQLRMLYFDYNTKLNEALVKYHQIKQKIKEKMFERNKVSKTSAFITFQTIEQRNYVLSLNRNNLLQKIKSLLPCCTSKDRFSLEKDGQTFDNLVIEPAPEPQDVKWGNIGISRCQKFFRGLFTISASAIMLTASFIIAYSLSTLQNKEMSSRFVSFLISLSISLCNLGIIKVIQLMTVIEKKSTNNNYQISLAVKSIVVQLINSIVVPFLVNFYIKHKNIYKRQGLIQDVFILSITNSFFPPLIRLIDPYYMIVALQRFYHNRPNRKIKLNQHQLNKHFQKPEFQLGLQYIYIISNFLFICFYVSLQPIIPIFGILGLFVMYWVQKYQLFRKSQRPVPGSDVVSSVMHQLIYFGGISYVLGSLTWSVFLDNQSFNDSLIGNLVASGLALFMLLFPYQKLIDYRQNQNSKNTYQQRRIFFTCEYDRLNPVTKDQAIQQYKQFLQNKRNAFQRASIQEKQQLLSEMQMIAQNNRTKVNNPNQNRFFQNKNLDAINDLFQNQCLNIMDPQMLQTVLLANDWSEVRSVQDKHNKIQFEKPKTGLNRRYSENDTLGAPSSKPLALPIFSDRLHYHQSLKKSIYRSSLNIAELGIRSSIRSHTTKDI